MQKNSLLSEFPWVKAWGEQRAGCRLERWGSPEGRAQDAARLPGRQRGSEEQGRAASHPGVPRGERAHAEAFPPDVTAHRRPQRRPLCSSASRLPSSRHAAVTFRLRRAFPAARASLIPPGEGPGNSALGGVTSSFFPTPAGSAQLRVRLGPHSPSVGRFYLSSLALTEPTRHETTSQKRGFTRSLVKEEESQPCNTQVTMWKTDSWWEAAPGAQPRAMGCGREPGSRGRR